MKACNKKLVRLLRHITSSTLGSWGLPGAPKLAVRSGEDAVDRLPRGDLVPLPQSASASATSVSVRQNPTKKLLNPTKIPK